MSLENLLKINRLQRHIASREAVRKLLMSAARNLEDAKVDEVNHVREFFNSADYVPLYTVFDVGGNNFRLVVIVRYRFKKVFVHKVMTHREYDVWNKHYRKGKGYAPLATLSPVVGEGTAKHCG